MFYFWGQERRKNRQKCSDDHYCIQRIQLQSIPSANLSERDIVNVSSFSSFDPEFAHLATLRCCICEGSENGEVSQTA
jgi:hypothetical protein